MKCFAQRKHTEFVVWRLLSYYTVTARAAYLNKQPLHAHRWGRNAWSFQTGSFFRSQFCLVTHSPSPLPFPRNTPHIFFYLQPEIPFEICQASPSVLPFFFLIYCNETLCPIAKKGGTSKGLPLIWLQTVVACAISVACSITMERFKCDPKVIRVGSMWSSKSVSRYFDLVWGYNLRSIWPTLALTPNLISAIWNI